VLRADPFRLHTAPSKRKRNVTTVNPRKSPKKSSKSDTATGDRSRTNPSGRETSDPEMVIELVTRLLDQCDPALRNEMAEKYGIDKKKLHTVSRLAFREVSMIGRV
jgi:hypothetical protein